MGSHGILISMSGKGNCCDTAKVETFFKTLKSELVWRAVFYTRQEADQAIGRYIDGFYNLARLTVQAGNTRNGAAYAVTRSNGGGVAEWLKAAVC